MIIQIGNVCIHTACYAKMKKGGTEIHSLCCYFTEYKVGLVCMNVMIFRNHSNQYEFFNKFYLSKFHRTCNAAQIADNLLVVLATNKL